MNRTVHNSPPDDEQRQNWRPDFLADATRTYLQALENSRVAFAYANSAFSVLQREIDRQSDPTARQIALDQLTVASGTTSHIATQANRHNDYIASFAAAPAASSAAPPSAVSDFTRILIVDRTPLRPENHYRTLTTASANVAGEEQYWRDIRDALRSYFNVPLRDLQPLLGIAYPTLVNLGKRKPHASTARTVLQLYSLVRHEVQQRGQSAARQWLSSIGRRTLEREGFEAFRALVIGRPDHQSPIGGIDFNEEPEAVPSASANTQTAQGARF